MQLIATFSQIRIWCSQKYV